MPTAQAPRWEGTHLPDQVIRCECGVVEYEIKNGLLRAVGNRPHHGEKHPNWLAIFPLDNQSRRATK